jgi:O-antigen ligase
MGAALTMLPFAFEIGTFDTFRPAKVKWLFLAISIMLAERLYAKKAAPLSLLIFFIVSVISGLFFIAEPQWSDLLVFFIAFLSLDFLPEGNDWDTAKRFLYFLTLGGVFCAIYGYFQVLGVDFITYFAWADRHRPSVFLGQHTLYGPFASACVCSALFLKRYKTAIFLAPIIYFIDSSFTYLSLGAGLMVWILHVTNWRICLIISLLGVLGLYGLQNTEAMNDKGRSVLWKQTITLANRKPIFGQGFGSFKTIYPVLQNPKILASQGIDLDKSGDFIKNFILEAMELRKMSGNFLSVHNEYIQVYFEMGLIGVIAMLFILYEFLVLAFTWIRTPYMAAMVSIVAVFMANSIGNFPMHLIPQALIPLWALTLLYRLSKPW